MSLLFGSQQSDFDAYKILSVDQDATLETIKRAWRDAVKRFHPDRGGSTERFQKISYAYEILSDSRKRRYYDMYGADALRGGARSFSSSSVLDDDKERNQERSFKPPPPPKQKCGAELKVKLSDLYNGATKRIRIKHNIECQACANDNAQAQQCVHCMGQGENVDIQQISPGNTVQARTPCRHCNQTGFVRPPSSCVTCGGTRKRQKKVTLEVQILPGMVHGQVILASTPQLEAVLTLKLRKHPKFRVGPSDRKRSDNDGDVPNDLLVFKKINLTDALMGCTVFVEHLDRRVLEVKTPAGRVVKPSLAYKIPGEGMPSFRNPEQRGDMYIKFSVVFPELTVNDVLSRRLKQLSEHSTSLLSHEKQAEEKNFIRLTKEEQRRFRDSQYKKNKPAHHFTIKHFAMIYSS